MTIKIINTVKQDHQQRITDYLNKNITPLLKKDVSNYAKKRKRLWLFHEANLGKNKTISNAHWDDLLWDLTKIFKPNANIALISLHNPPESDARIEWHRDDTYAHQNAILVNLGGNCLFGYQEDRGSNKPGTPYEIQTGEIIAFNCKHRHKLIDADPGRWGLILWQIKGHKNHPGLKPTNPKTFN